MSIKCPIWSNYFITLFIILLIREGILQLRLEVGPWLSMCDSLHNSHRHAEEL